MPLLCKIEERISKAFGDRSSIVKAIEEQIRMRGLNIRQKIILQSLRPSALADRRPKNALWTSFIEHVERKVIYSQDIRDPVENLDLMIVRLLHQATDDFLSEKQLSVGNNVINHMRIWIDKGIDVITKVLPLLDEEDEENTAADGDEKFSTILSKALDDCSQAVIIAFQ
jgi:hypothetical protein